MISKIAIVIPCFRARGKIDLFIKKLLKIKNIMISQCEINIYLVNDYCPEDSYREIENLDDIILLHHKNNLGVGAATLTGFKKALKDENHLFIKMDADGQHPAEYLIELIPYLASLPIDKLIMVKGSRYSLQVTDDESPLIRRFGSFFLEPLARISLTYKGLSDIANGFISFNLITLEYILSKRFVNKIEKRFLFESSIIKACSNLGADIHEFNMHSNYGLNWSSSMNSYGMILPLLIYWSKSICTTIFSKYIYRFNLGSFLLISSVTNFLVSAVLFGLQIYPNISRGVVVTPGNASGFTSSFLLSVLIFCFFVLYDSVSRVKVKKVFFRIYAKDKNTIIK